MKLFSSSSNCFERGERIFVWCFYISARGFFSQSNLELGVCALLGWRKHLTLFFLWKYLLDRDSNPDPNRLEELWICAGNNPLQYVDYGEFHAE